jgi:hypothetical protein
MINESSAQSSVSAGSRGWSVTVSSDFTYEVGSADGDVRCTVTTDLTIDAGHDGKRFQMSSFRAVGVRENVSSQVHFRDQDGSYRRIGWLIPAVALASREHDKSENEHFLKYAHQVVRWFLANLTIDAIEKAQEETGFGTPIPLSRLLPDDVAFLALSEETYAEILDFDPDRNLLALTARGLIREDFANQLGPLVRPADVDGETIRIQAVSADIDNNELLIRLLATASSVSADPIVRFFYAYQLIEFLLEDVLVNQLSHVKSQLISALQDANASPSDIREANQAVQEELSEKKRLDLLVGSYVGGAGLPSGGRVYTACESLLVALGKPPKKGIQSAYAVRNLVFHSARSLDVGEIPLLEAVADAFVTFLPELLSAYKRPTN